MSASLNDGATYSGQFFQVTRDATVDHYAPLWAGWEGRRGRGRGFGSEWGYWGPETGFVTEYTGKVLANLADATGKHMRCRFTLRHPSSGLSQGGIGRCQLPGGDSIDASFPPS